jgi:F-type H+-transporting ATPase subunit b
MDVILEKFGIEWPSILLTLAASVMLVSGMYFLLVKPVKKIMAERRAKAEEVFEENTRLKNEAQQTAAELERRIADADKKAADILSGAEKSAEDKAAQIVAEAAGKAQEVMLNAKLEAEAERARMERQFKTEITSLAVDIAGKMLEREVKIQDNAKIVDEALSAWGKS